MADYFTVSPAPLLPSKNFLQFLTSTGLVCTVATTYALECGAKSETCTLKNIGDHQKYDEDAIKAYHDFDYATALKNYKLLLDQNLTRGNERIITATAAGASAFHLGRYHEALKYYTFAEKQLIPLGPDDRKKLEAEIVCSMGETFYEEGNRERSAERFLSAIALWKSNRASDDILMRSLEGLGASYYQDGKFAQAVPVYEELAWRDGKTLGVDSLQYGWSLRILADALKATGKNTEATACIEHSAYIFRNWNKDRLFDQYKYLLNTMRADELNDKLIQRIIGTLGFNQDLSFIKPATFTGVPERGGSLPYDPIERRKTMVPWTRHRIVMTDPAGVVWVDPLAKPVGVIVCVPGFGLQHGSYDAFGKLMAKLGYLVVSYDVRGFGAYTALKARNRIDLENTIADLTTSAKLLRSEFPGLPLFVLGESMGGSVALQFVATHPELVDGLIAAVPSAKRYGGWLASAKIGLGMLASPDQTANLQSYLVKRATTDPTLRSNLQNDPESRFTMTSDEMDKYNRFLKQNAKRAAMITKTPVIMFQGLSDLLIRPEGAVRLVRQIGTQDKELVLIGRSQHLLFEHGQFNDDIISQVTNWLTMHSQAK